MVCFCTVVVVADGIAVADAVVDVAVVDVAVVVVDDIAVADVVVVVDDVVDVAYQKICGFDLVMIWRRYQNALDVD